jgi:uncharacterized membrane protein YhhN
MDSAGTLTSGEKLIAQYLNDLYDHDPEVFQIYGAAVALLLTMLYFDYKQDTIGKLFTKTPLSLTFVYLAYVLTKREDTASIHDLNHYQFWVVVGLCCGVLGDVALVFTHKILFLAGLIVFLLGHVAYIWAFLNLLQNQPACFTNPIVVPYIGAVVLVAALIFTYYRPYMARAKMLVPGFAYVGVIATMVATAVFVYFDPSYTLEGRNIILAGAGFFFLSDICVAHQRFRYRSFANRLLGLPLYYAAQFLIAASVGHMHLTSTTDEIQ